MRGWGTLNALILTPPPTQVRGKSSVYTLNSASCKVPRGKELHLRHEGWRSVSMRVLIAQSYPMDSGPPGSSVHVILRQEYWSGLPFPSPGQSAYWQLFALTSSRRTDGYLCAHFSCWGSKTSNDREQLKGLFPYRPAGPDS